jgi:hypothetical protein
MTQQGRNVGVCYDYDKTFFVHLSVISVFA